MPLSRVPIPSPFYSSRAGARARLIVVHTAEGATTYQSLGSYFQHAEPPVSSHVGIDDTPGTVGEYVRRDGSAWTQADANPVAVAAELCAFAAWDSAEWDRHPTMLANCAAWLAEEAAHFGIPLVRLTPAQAQGGGAGVCQHIDLGSWGGGHVDCGPAFPLDRVIAMAAGPTPEDDDLPLNDADKKWITDTVAKQVNDALRQQFRPDQGECYGRVVQAGNTSIGQNGGSFVKWAEQGAAQAIK